VCKKAKAVFDQFYKQYSITITQTNGDHDLNVLGYQVFSLYLNYHGTKNGERIVRSTLSEIHSRIEYKIVLNRWLYAMGVFPLNNQRCYPVDNVILQPYFKLEYSEEQTNAIVDVYCFWSIDEYLKSFN